MTFTAALTLDEARARALADAIAADPRLGDQTVDVHETAPGRWQVVVYFAERPDKAARDGLARAARQVPGSRVPAFSIEALPETDWVAKSLEGLAPVRVGRFLVHGGHDRDKVRPNDLAIEIEAGQAFGTGHHGTTAGCLATIDRIAKCRRPRRALDIGTGSGVLAIAIAKRCRIPVLASDNDPVATAVAGANARANGVGGLVRTATAEGIDRRIFGASGPYDLIVANILAGPLVALAPAIRRHVAPGGDVILSGLLPEQRARIVAACGGQGLRLARSDQRDGWLTVMFHRADKQKGRP
jgi:ribosomal protein L11 methyltransferase